MSGRQEALGLDVSEHWLSLRPSLALGLFPGDVRHRLTADAAMVTATLLLRILSLVLLTALCIRKPQDKFILELSQEKVWIKNDF